MGVSASLNPQVAYVTSTRVVLPLVIAMWFYSRTWRGGFIAAAPLLYQLIVNDGFNVQNPTLSAFDTNEADANTIFNGIFPILGLISIMVGLLICFFFNLPDPFPLYLWVTSGSTLYSGADTRQKLVRRPQSQQQAAIYDEYALEETGLQVTFDGITYENVPRPSMHMVIWTFAFLLCVVLPFVFFEQMLISGVLVDYAVWFITLGIMFFAYLMFGLIVSYASTSLWIFGPAENNMKGRDELVEMDEQRRQELFAATRRRVGIFFATLAIFEIIPFAVIGGIAAWMNPPSADACWITAVVGQAIILFIILCVYLYYGPTRNNPERVGTGPTMYLESRKGVPQRKTNLLKIK